MHSSARRTDSLFPLTRVATATLLSLAYCTFAHAGGTAFDATSCVFWPNTPLIPAQRLQPFQGKGSTISG